MNDFLLIFRSEAVNNDPTPSPEHMQAMMKPWQDWMGSLAAQNKLVTAGDRLASDGKVIKPGITVTDGPYVELKEAVAGYTIIRANSLDEATELAKGCPILMRGGTVEVRAVIPMN